MDATGNKIGQGKDNAMSYLKDNPESLKIIEEQLYAIILPDEKNIENYSEEEKLDKKNKKNKKEEENV